MKFIRDLSKRPMLLRDAGLFQPVNSDSRDRVLIDAALNACFNEYEGEREMGIICMNKFTGRPTKIIPFIDIHGEICSTIKQDASHELSNKGGTSDSGGIRLNGADSEEDDDDDHGMTSQRRSRHGDDDDDDDDGMTSQRRPVPRFGGSSGSMQKSRKKRESGGRNQDMIQMVIKL